MVFLEKSLSLEDPLLLKFMKQNVIQTTWN